MIAKYIKKIQIFGDIIDSRKNPKRQSIFLGDSWSNLTLFNFFTYDTIDWLKEMGMNLIDVGWPGYTISKELKLKMFEQAVNGIRKNQREVLIFVSLGGNDMLAIPSDELLNQTSLSVERTLGRMMLLIGNIKQYCFQKGIRPTIVFHGYDYVHAEKETLGLKGILTWRFGHDQSDNQINDMMKKVLDKFNESGKFLAESLEDVHFVDLRGTLSGVNDMVEDIHPDKFGYKKIAERFYEKAKELGFA